MFQQRIAILSLKYEYAPRQKTYFCQLLGHLTLDFLHLKELYLYFFISIAPSYVSFPEYSQVYFWEILFPQFTFISFIQGTFWITLSRNYLLFIFTFIIPFFSFSCLPIWLHCSTSATTLTKLMRVKTWFIFSSSVSYWISSVQNIFIYVWNYQICRSFIHIYHIDTPLHVYYFICMYV